MDRAFELMLAEIHRYEGTVNQFLGDGLMALFGAPIAHEDHTLRAVHAGLGIQRALLGYREELRNARGIEFQTRIGMNAGTVVVGKIGDNLRMDYTGRREFSRSKSSRSRGRTSSSSSRQRRGLDSRDPRSRTSLPRRIPVSTFARSCPASGCRHS